MFAVLDKMEAKPEDGPEMDVDGAPTDGQNCKKCHSIASCSVLMFQALMLSPLILISLYNAFTATVKSLRRKCLCLYKSYASICFVETLWMSYIMLVLTGFARRFGTFIIIYCRMGIISFSKYLCILTPVYNIVVITRFGTDIMLLLFILCLCHIYTIVTILPYKPYATVEYITDWYRRGRYRE
jgi:hypothetical protein